jgi:aspartate racemase
MKTIGLIGGMSWESTVPYYAMINEAVRARLGGLHSARILLYSMEFAEIERMQHEGRWEDAGAVLADLVQAGVSVDSCPRASSYSPPRRPRISSASAT